MKATETYKLFILIEMLALICLVLYLNKMLSKFFIIYCLIKYRSLLTVFVSYVDRKGKEVFYLTTHSTHFT